MARKTDKDLYGKQEAKSRFEAALRGSLKVGPKPMKTVTPKVRKNPADKKTTKPSRT